MGMYGYVLLLVFTDVLVSVKINGARGLVP